MEELEQVDPVWRRHHHSPSTSPTPVTATSFDNNLMTTDSSTVSADSGGGNESGGGGTKHNGQMNNLMDDMGPETDVDSLDDVLLSPSIAAAKALSTAKQPQVVNKNIPVWPEGRLQKEQQQWLQTLPWSYADAVRNSPQKKQPVLNQEELEEKQEEQVTKVNFNDDTMASQQNVLLCQQTNTVTVTQTPTECATIDAVTSTTQVLPPKVVKPTTTTDNRADEAVISPTLSQHCANADNTHDDNQQLQGSTTTTPSVTTAIVAADLSKGEELKSDVGVNDIDSGEDSEEEWNYISGKETGNKDIQIPVQQIQQGLNAEETEEDMESQLNPNAAEFVPVFIPSNSGVSQEKDISSSPAKGSEQNLENILIPSVKEFYSEISKRPSDLESLNHDKSLNETTMNGVDLTGISTKAVYGGDDSNFLSSVNNSAIASNAGDDEDEAIEVAGNLCDTNPFSPTHIPITEPFGEEPLKKNDVIQDQMVQDHFSLGIKQFDPMAQSVTMMEDEGQHEDETSPDIDLISSGKPDLLSPEANQEPAGIAVGNEAHEGHTSSSGFDSESGPDDGDHIPAEQCNLAAAAAAVGISFGEEVDLQGIVNTKSMFLIDDSHPIEKIEQSLSPSVSPMPQLTTKEEVKEETVTKEKEIKTEIPAQPKSNVPFEDTSISTNLKNEDDFEATILKQGATLTEIEIKGVSPDQVFDLVQKLQFTQEEPLSDTNFKNKDDEPLSDINSKNKDDEPLSDTNSKNKDDEPLSDSGFEIIHVSEASNEPVAPEEEEKQNYNVEQPLVSDLVPNYVPDILQVSEIGTDRQLSPVGTGTENIIADIEGAMLDNVSPTSGHVINQRFTKIEEENLNKPVELHAFATDRSEEVLEEKNKIEEISKSLLEEEDKEQLKESGILIGEHLPDTKESETTRETGKIIGKDGGDVDSAKTDDEVREVIRDALCAIAENSTEEISHSQTKEITCDESANILVTEGISEPIKYEEVSKILVEEQQSTQNFLDKKEIEEQLVTVGGEDVTELLEKPTLIEPPGQKEPTIEQEKKVVEIIEGSLSVNEEKTKLEEVIVSQPTPPTTPAPGVTEEADKQELIAAALMAAGVAAGTGAAVLTSSTETSKAEEKVVPVSKKPGVGTTITSKKQEPSKMGAAKPSLGNSKSPAKPSVPGSAAAKKPASTTGSTTKSTTSKTSVSSTKQITSTASKPSTPTSKVGATSRPSSAKVSATTTKSPALSAPAKTPKPRTPTSTKPPTARPLAKPTTATAPKKPETVPTKKPLTSTVAKSPSTTTTSKAPTTVSKSISAAPPPKSTTKTISSVASKTLTSKLTSTSTTKSSTTPSAAKPTARTTAGSTVGATKTTSVASTKAPISKLAPAKTAATANSATKALPTKTKPATPTAIKKPLSSDKNIKDTANNKLSAAKQAGAIKKNEVNKTIPIETKLIEPVTQEPTVTTTNGHIENGISNESSSPIEVALN